jgi:transposase
VLACADGGTNAAVGRAVGVSCQTAGKWRARFLAERTEGLRDGARCGAPRHLKLEDLGRVMALSLLASPAHAARWSTRSLAEACALSQSSIARIWRGLGLRPSSRQQAHHRADALVLAKLEELMQLYCDPRRRARVRVHRVVTRGGLADWLAEADAAVPCEDRAELILTEYGPEAAAAARSWLAGHPRFTLHLAPRGPLWTELIGHWFPPGNASDPRTGLLQLALNRVATPYAWTPRGREMIETSVKSMSR